MKKKFFYAIQGILFGILLLNGVTVFAGPEKQNSQQQDKKGDGKKGDGKKENKDSGKKGGKKSSDTPKTASVDTGTAPASVQPTQVVQVNEDVPTPTQDVGSKPITFQPPLVQVVQGNVLSATADGVDVTDDLKKLIVYYVTIDNKKYSGAGKDFLSFLFEGDPSPKNELQYVVVFADGTRKDLGLSKKGMLKSPQFTQPFQVLEARFGGMSGKGKAPSYTDVTRYLQDNIYATISGAAIKTEQDPAKVQALNTLMQKVSKNLVQITLNGATAPASLVQGWPVRTTLRAPGAAPIGSLKPQPKWTLQNWDNRIPAKVLKKPEVTITAIQNRSYRTAEAKNYQKLPAALQAVVNENKTADPNEKTDKKGKKGKKDKKGQESPTAPTGLNTATSPTVVSTQKPAA